MTLSLQARAQAVRLRGAAGTARLAFTGESMRPLLRAPMVLEVGPVRHVRIGDVVVFVHSQRLVAHRVVARRDGGYVTAGDTVPECTEFVRVGELLGVVERVFEDARPRARCLERGWRFRLAGALLARSRPVRAVCRRAARALARPSRSPGLLEMLAAVVRRDENELASVLERCDAAELASAALEHRCAGVISAALQAPTLRERPAALELYRRLRPAAWASASQCARIAAIADRCLEALRAQRIPVVLLKGAARIAKREPGHELHPSSDVDVLVAPQDCERAVRALLHAGFTYGVKAEAVERYRARHHHAAPLRAPGDGPALEVHVRLAPSGVLLAPLDWDALREHLVPARLTGTYVLDDVATLVHYAVHSVESLQPRDLVLMAQILQRNPALQRAGVERAFAFVRSDAQAVHAILALAAELCGRPWTLSRAERAYAAWLRRKIRLPAGVRARSQAVDAYFALRAGGLRRAAAVLTRTLDADPSEPREAFASHLKRLVGRVAVGICAAVAAR